MRYRARVDPTPGRHAAARGDPAPRRRDVDAGDLDGGAPLLEHARRLHGADGDAARDEAERAHREHPSRAVERCRGVYRDAGCREPACGRGVEESDGEPAAADLEPLDVHGETPVGASRGGGVGKPPAPARAHGADARPRDHDVPELEASAEEGERLVDDVELGHPDHRPPVDGDAEVADHEPAPERAADRSELHPGAGEGIVERALDALAHDPVEDAAPAREPEAARHREDQRANDHEGR